MRRSIALVFAIGFALPGCGGHNGAPAGPKVPIVRYSLPIEREVTDYEHFTGRTEAVNHVQVVARVTGFLDKVNFKDGSIVNEGDVLFAIDPRPYKATLDRAVAQVALAEAKLKLASVELNRGLAIAKTPGAISQGDLDKYAAEKSSAEATLQAAKAEAESADLNLKFTNVHARISGRVGAKLVPEGNLIKQDNTLLTTIESMDPMYAYFDVDERTMLRIQSLIRAGKIKSVKEGVKTPIQYGLANEGQTYPHPGDIDFVNNRVDTSTGTLQVRGLLDNPMPPGNSAHLLTPGLFIRVRVPIGVPHQAILVPQAAIGTDQGKKFLYAIDDQNKVEYRPIQPGPQQPEGLQVVEPLKIVRNKDGVRVALPGEQGIDSITAADKIIVGGLQRVRSGMTVDPKPAADQRK